MVRSFIPVSTSSEVSVREVDHQQLDVLPYKKPSHVKGDSFDEGESLSVKAMGASPESGLQAVGEELEAARRQAEEIMQQAREEAERIREDARQQGYAQGQEQGYQDGMKEARDELEEAKRHQEQTARQEVSEALGSIEQAKNRCLRDYLDELKDCSIAVAEKVIHTSLEASGDIIKRMIVFETEKLKKTAWVKIYMEKMDYDMMMEADGNLVSELAKVSDNIKFVVMEKEQRGSCIIETPEEIIDIGAETQMENIREITGTIRV